MKIRILILAFLCLFLLFVNCVDTSLTDYQTTTGKIVDKRYYKKRYYYFEYTVDSKKYILQQPTYLQEIKIGELYEIRYQIKNPEKAKVDFETPIIIDSSDFMQTFGVIKEINNTGKTGFIYNVNNVEYRREQYINSKELTEGDTCTVIYNKNEPSIGYLGLVLKF